jgi:hypothetical protein
VDERAQPRVGGAVRVDDDLLRLGIAPAAGAAGDRLKRDGVAERLGEGDRRRDLVGVRIAREPRVDVIDAVIAPIKAETMLDGVVQLDLSRRARRATGCRLGEKFAANWAITLRDPVVVADCIEAGCSIFEATTPSGADKERTLGLLGVGRASEAPWVSITRRR